jgi:hypothetical protein
MLFFLRSALSSSEAGIGRGRRPELAQASAPLLITFWEVVNFATEIKNAGPVVIEHPRSLEPGTILITARATQVGMS